MPLLTSNVSSYRLTIIVLIASTFTVMAGSAIAPALPGMLLYFHDTNNADLKIRMAIGISAGATMVCSHFVGKLSDKIGYITTLKWGLIIIVASGLAGLVAVNLNQVLLTRCVLGAGVAAVAISTTAWIGDQHNGINQHKVTGYLGLAMESSGLVYFGLAGALALLHWRAVFLIYLLPVFILFMLPKQQKRAPLAKQSVDIGDKNYRVYGLIMAASFIALFGLNIYVTQLPFLFAEQNASSLVAGFALAAASLSAAAASLIFPKIMHKRHQAAVLSIAFACSSVGFIALFLFSSVVMMSVAVLICGFGFGLTIPCLISWINTVSNEHNRGAGQAKLAMAGFSGQLVSPLAFQPFVTNMQTALGFLAFATICFLFCIVIFMYSRSNDARYAPEVE